MCTDVLVLGGCWLGGHQLGQIYMHIKVACSCRVDIAVQHIHGANRHDEGTKRNCGGGGHSKVHVQASARRTRLLLVGVVPAAVCLEANVQQLQLHQGMT